MGQEQVMSRFVAVYDIRCPFCDAKPGAECPGRRPCPERRDRARQLAMGEVPGSAGRCALGDVYTPADELASPKHDTYHFGLSDLAEFLGGVGESYGVRVRTVLRQEVYARNGWVQPKRVK